MLKRLQFKWPSRRIMGKLPWVGVVIGAGVLAFFWGRHAALSQGTNPTPPGQIQPGRPDLAPAPGNSSSYNQRVVGYVSWGGQQVAITREELGEYLITRLGADRLDFLINRKIIEMACASKGITVSDQDIEKQYAADLEGFNKMPEKDFVNVLLKRRGQSLYEWKEDVIRPRLLMSHYCNSEVHVEEEDIQKAYEARFGDKVQCRMIVLSKEMLQKNTDIWAKVRDNDEEFRKMALQSCIPAVAAHGGEIPPIHRHFSDKRIEDAAFSLKEGMVGPLLQMEDGTSIILKCDKRIPDEFKTHKIAEVERLKMHDEIFEAK